MPGVVCDARIEVGDVLSARSNARPDSVPVPVPGIADMHARLLLGEALARSGEHLTRLIVRCPAVTAEGGMEWTKVMVLLFIV